MADDDRLDDAALVAALCAGDENALEEIYRRHGGAVWSIARRVCRDPDLAQDITQHVFTALWAQPDRYDPERGTLRAWLATQAHGRAVDAVRSEAARRRREDRDSRLAPTTAQDTETAVPTAILSDDLRRALSRLPKPQRQAITVAYFGGHTFKESARLLDAPEGTIKSRIRLGLGSLRRALAAEGITP